jgi:hypothetical protein
VSGPLNRWAYTKLIAENLGWLERQPHRLERTHIATILVWSVGQLYGAPEESPEHDWLTTKAGERCALCLTTRTKAGAWWEYEDAYGRHQGVLSPPPKCSMPQQSKQDEGRA